MTRILYFLFITIWLACSPVYYDDVQEQSAQTPAEFTPELRAEPYFMRIDLLRQTTTSTDSDGNSSTEPTAYSPIGIYLGGGLFVDAHKNVSLLVEDLYQKAGQDLTLVFRGSRSESGRKMDYVRRSDYFYRQSNALLSGKDEVWAQSGFFHFERPHSQRRIAVSPAALTYYQFLSKEELGWRERDFYYQGLLDKDNISVSPDHLTWDRLRMTRESVGLTIANGWEDKITVTTDGTTWLVYNRYFRGYRIWRSGDKIFIEENGKRCGSWELK